MSDRAEKLRHNFTYHPPKNDQPTKYQLIRESAFHLACIIEKYCPESREKSLAITNLEQCVMWANAGIARNE